MVLAGFVVFPKERQHWPVVMIICWVNGLLSREILIAAMLTQESMTPDPNMLLWNVKLAILISARAYVQVH